MNFLSMFRSQIPNIIKRLNNVRVELNTTQNNIKHLMLAEQKWSSESGKIEKAIDSFGVATWIKDLKGQFLYVNKICCETILECTAEKALGLTNGDLKKDALSKVCMKSDEYVLKSGITKRFIEMAKYDNGQRIIIDTVKSPVFSDDGDLIGTIGNAVNITELLPDEIKKRGSSSIEIPMDTTLEPKTFITLLEKRLKPR